jgi:hypothetical protein
MTVVEGSVRQRGLDQLRADAERFHLTGVKLYTADRHGDFRGWRTSSGSPPRSATSTPGSPWPCRSSTPDEDARLHGRRAAWGWLILWAATRVSEGSAAVCGLFVALAAFGMCAQAAWGPPAFIPGAFVGAAAYFGNQGIFWATLVSLVAGALLAFASERLADVIEKTLPMRGGASSLPTTTPA